MSDTINPSVNDVDDEDLFIAAQDQFPSKADFKDRLVVIYPTGRKGTRQGENGEPYPWYETTTVVLDDGPNGWQPTVIKDGEPAENLIPSVAENGPQVMTKIQWSATGIASRIATQLPGRMKNGDRVDIPGSVVGRINSRKNSKPGLAPAWSIAKPTEDEMALARRYRDVCAAARAAIVAEREQEADKDAF